MSRLFAVVSTVAAGAVASAALLSGLAFATSAAVTFDGASLLGLPMLSCASKPDTTAVLLETGQSLEIRNLTGHDAAIYVNGSKAASNAAIASKSEAPVTFPVGTWTVSLVPSCLLNLDDAESVTVTVNTPPPARIAPPAPPATHTQTAPTPPANPTNAPTVASNPTTAPVSRPTATPSSAGSGVTPTPTATEPTAGAHPSRSTTRAGAVPSGTDGGLYGPEADPSAATDGAATDDGVMGGSGGATSMDVAGVDPSRIAIGPSISLGAAGTPGPNYLLVVLTAVGIIGVGAAAIRALIARRTVRRAY
jgi:hypothetical protein